MNDNQNDQSTTALIPEVMTVKQLANYLQVSDRVVYNMAATGEVPGVKIANQWRFPKADIDRWLSDLAWSNIDHSETSNGED